MAASRRNDERGALLVEHAWLIGTIALTVSVGFTAIGGTLERKFAEPQGGLGGAVVIADEDPEDEQEDPDADQCGEGWILTTQPLRDDGSATQDQNLDGFVCEDADGHRADNLGWYD